MLVDIIYLQKNKGQVVVVKDHKAINHKEHIFFISNGTFVTFQSQAWNFFSN